MTESRVAYEREIEMLEAEWSPDGGFFWNLRQGDFSDRRAQQVLQVLSSIETSEETCLPLRFVSLMWYIPTFMRWQTERVVEAGVEAGAYNRVVNAFTSEVQRVLGVP